VTAKITDVAAWRAAKSRRNLAIRKAQQAQAIADRMRPGARRFDPFFDDIDPKGAA
jgi:hypothetical protein